ncbi:hypothetical protein O6H91_04G012400 [Diphasiastrum complanatum]|nr:hypothetical protein O6H91_04G012400 [Diphasiastrum complanatum]
MQRVATYFMEGLAARVTKVWPGVYKALQCTQLPSASDLLETQKAFFYACPFLKFAFLTVNQAILDAMQGERVVHIVDLDSYEVVQWLALLQAFSSRPGGPPHLRITVVSKRRDILLQMARRLSEEAERLDIPFQFHPVHVSLGDLEADMLGIKTGEAVAVSSVMKLHSLLAEEDVDVANGSNNLHKVSSSQTVTETLTRKGTFGTEDIEWPGKQNSSGELIYEQKNSRNLQRDDSEDAQFLRSWLHASGSKRSRDEFEEDARELRRFQDTDMGGDGAISSTYQFLAPTFPCADLSLSRQPDGRKSSSEAVARSKKTVRTLFPWSQDSLKAGRVTPHSFGKESAIDRVLRVLRDLSPKAMVLVEQDSSHNGSTLSERFVEALYYYSAMFDSVDSTLPHNCHDRMTIEKHLFGEEIKNIVACEGLERLERHEKLIMWRKRMERARFVPLILNTSTIFQAENLLRSYASDGYRLVEDNGCLTLCWHSTPLLSSSAWQM